MNSIVQQLYRMLNGLWYQHQRELDERDERITDLEMIIENYKYEINQLRSQLDQYQSIFSVSQTFKRYSDFNHDHRRSGVSAPPSSELYMFIVWEKSSW